MDHSAHAHAGHDSMPMPRCSMHMLWNTQIPNTCIVFPWWHISSTASFVFSCLVIVGLGVLYEYLREVQRAYDRRVAVVLGAKGRDGRAGSGVSTPEMEAVSVGLLSGRRAIAGRGAGIPVPFVFRVIRASLYASTIALSFFLMLVFMTYNAYLIAAVVVGAGLGHYIFGAAMNVDAVLNDAAGPRSMACH